MEKNLQQTISTVFKQRTQTSRKMHLGSFGPDESFPLKSSANDAYLRYQSFQTSLGNITYNSNLDNSWKDEVLELFDY